MQPYQGIIEIDGKKISWETTFDQSIKFNCVHCGFSCTNSHVDLSGDDLNRIKEHNYANFYQTYKKDDEEGFFIKGSDIGLCPFRKEQKCSIHGFKPTVCTLYPFKLAPASKEKIYIDLANSCKAILNENFTEKNEIDYNSLIEQNYPILKFEFFGYKTFEEFYERMKHQIDDELILKKSWAAIVFSLSKLNNLSELWDLMNVFQKILREKYQKLDKNNLDNFLRDSIITYKSQKFSHDEFYNKLYLMNLQKEPRPYNSINWDTNTPYYIKILENKLNIYDENQSKEIDINKIRIKNLSNDAKALLINYFLKIWDRQTLWQFFCISFYVAKKENPKLSSLDAQIEIMKKKMLFFQFLMDIVSEKNMHENIEANDVKEALMMMDLLFMQS